MDTRTHLEETSGYNIGEMALASYMLKNNYTRVGDSGVWKSKDEQHSLISTKAKMTTSANNIRIEREKEAKKNGCNL